MKIDISKCNRLIEEGFSLIISDKDKKPLGKWKESQTTPIKKDEFQRLYNLPNAEFVGIVTGFMDIECFDIDLKAITVLKEKTDFWAEYMSFLKDNIDDFERKFVICKTVSAGYHIIYRTKKPQGNSKIARFKDYKECVIETRGIGGYIVAYDNFIQGDSYLDLKYITDEDREILFNISGYYNYIPEQPQQHEIKVAQHYAPIENEITPWADFNNKTDVWSLISDEFTIIRKLSERVIIRRIGAKSAHSGYIYNSNRLYLFSTGTIYPNEQLLSPFSIYTIKRHHGDFKAAGNELYQKGFGSRRIPKVKALEKKPVIDKDIVFPIDIFPVAIQNYIIQVHKTLNSSIDYLGCSFLWALSIAVGNSHKVEVKKGWMEAAVLWIAIVGKAGVGKTHNINNMTFPLNKINAREINKHEEEKRNFQAYQELSAKEKKCVEKISEPVPRQFIVSDITIESLIDYHSSNPNGIGVLRDELSGWIKDMNKYRPGSDLETMLSVWSNQHIIVNRKTAKSNYVPKAFIPILGGVQPSILSMHFTEENKENGLIDRILLCYPEVEVEKYNDQEMKQEIIDWYEAFLISFFDTIKGSLEMFDDNSTIKSNIVRFSPEAKKEWIRVHDKIVDIQNSDEENEYMKSMLPKQKSYIPRFALIISIINRFERGESVNGQIERDSILAAERLSEYFIFMARKNKFETIERTEMVEIIKESKKNTPRDKFTALFAADQNLNRTKIADILGVSRASILRWISEETTKKV